MRIGQPWNGFKVLDFYLKVWRTRRFPKHWCKCVSLSLFLYLSLSLSLYLECVWPRGHWPWSHATEVVEDLFLLSRWKTMPILRSRSLIEMWPTCNMPPLPLPLPFLKRASSCWTLWESSLFLSFVLKWRRSASNGMWRRKGEQSDQETPPVQRRQYRYLSVGDIKENTVAFKLLFLFMTTIRCSEK